jgi:hypothetical protein
MSAWIKLSGVDRDVFVGEDSLCRGDDDDNVNDHNERDGGGNAHGRLWESLDVIMGPSVMHVERERLRLLRGSAARARGGGSSSPLSRASTTATTTITRGSQRCGGGASMTNA